MKFPGRAQKFGGWCGGGWWGRWGWGDINAAPDKVSRGPRLLHLSLILTSGRAGHFFSKAQNLLTASIIPFLFKGSAKSLGSSCAGKLFKTHLYGPETWMVDQQLRHLLLSLSELYPWDPQGGRREPTSTNGQPSDLGA